MELLTIWANSFFDENEIVSKYDGRLEFEELRTLDKIDENGQKQTIVIGRGTELRIVNADSGISILHDQT